MDVSNMTIEGFFLEDYKNLRDENAELKKRVQEVDKEHQYGIFDLGKPIELVKVEKASSYKFTSGSCDLSNASSGYIKSVLDKDDKRFIEWCRSYVLDSWSTKPISVAKEKYRYTVKIVDMDGTRFFAVDSRHLERMVEIYDNDDAEGHIDYSVLIGRWAKSKFSDKIISEAASSIRSILEKLYEDKLENEQQQDSDGEDTEESSC